MPPHKTTQPASPFVVTVDGPAGSGKSFLCAQLCQSLGWTYVITGQIYRALGYVLLTKGFDLRADPSTYETALKNFAEQLVWKPSQNVLSYENKDLIPYLKTETAGTGASMVASHPLVRSTLLATQRNLLNAITTVGVIFDGRDCGSILFPNAPLKIFLTASLAVRARRRLEQLRRQGQLPLPLLSDLMADMHARDVRDTSREVAPLIQAPDAQILDTSDLGPSEAQTALGQIINLGLAGWQAHQGWSSET